MKKSILFFVILSTSLPSILPAETSHPTNKTWIRQFADGTHNWKDHHKKLNFNITEFKCLNYSNVLALHMPFDKNYLPKELPTWADNSPRYFQELSSMCILQDPNSTLGGKCAQANIPNGKMQFPVLNVAGAASIDTYFKVLNGNQTSYTKSLNNFVPYFFQPANLSGTNKTYSEFANPQTKNRLDVFLPAYIDGERNIKDMSLVIACDNGKTELSSLPLISSSNPESVMNNDDTGCLKWKYFGGSSVRPGLLSIARKDAGNSDCLEGDDSTCADPTTDGSLVKMKYDYTKNGCNQNINVTTCNADQTLIAFLRVSFYQIGHPDHVLSDGSTLENSTNGSAAVNYTIGSSPGSAIYYENKLSRFELTGIPQIVYEPVYCNSNHSELVPDLFKASSSTIKMRSDVQLDQKNCNSKNKFFPAPYLGESDPTNSPACVTSAENVALPTQFSSSKIISCSQLGATAKSDTECCSSFRDQSGICKLPAKTDLNLYLNKFVSGEGSRLKDSEFDLRTGYPKLTVDVYNKIRSLGITHCENGTIRMGGAFGNFAGQPHHPQAVQLEKRPYSIVDSNFDKDWTNEDEQGFDAFADGFRWNSHVYCK